MFLFLLDIDYNKAFDTGLLTVVRKMYTTRLWDRPTH